MQTWMTVTFSMRANTMPFSSAVLSNSAYDCIMCTDTYDQLLQRGSERAAASEPSVLEAATPERVVTTMVTRWPRLRMANCSNRITSAVAAAPAPKDKVCCSLQSRQK